MTKPYGKIDEQESSDHLQTIENMRAELLQAEKTIQAKNRLIMNQQEMRKQQSARFRDMKMMEIKDIKCQTIELIGNLVEKVVELESTLEAMNANQENFVKRFEQAQKRISELEQEVENARHERSKYVEIENLLSSFIAIKERRLSMCQNTFSASCSLADENSSLIQ